MVGTLLSLCRKRLRPLVRYYYPIFKFPYGEREMIVIGGEQGSSQLKASDSSLFDREESGEKIVQIRSRPSGRYEMFRQLWGLRLSAFGTPDLFSKGINASDPPSSKSNSNSPNLNPSSSSPYPQNLPPFDPSIPKSMSDSLIQIHLPFLQNPALLSDYQSITGGIRFGKIMEDLDVFAATCAYLHCGTVTPLGEKITIVTAAVDRIDLLEGLGEVVDLRIKGMVTFVGTSSMEITILVESSKNNQELTETESNHTKSANLNNGSNSLKPPNLADTINKILFYNSNSSSSNPSQTIANDNKWKLAAIAKFIMVARSDNGKKAMPVPRLLLQTPQENEIFSLGQFRHKLRIDRDRQSLFKEPPTALESVLLHKLFLATPSTPTLKFVNPSHTILKTTRICHPQERNIHNFIFGGYLMREAFELAHACALVFVKSSLPHQVSFLSVDELAFKHPVPIGALLELSSQVVYTTEPHSYHAPLSQLIHIEVVADVVDIRLGDRKTTNTFHFTFKATIEPSVQNLLIYSIKPQSYLEGMKYLEAKRRIEAVSQLD